MDREVAVDWNERFSGVDYLYGRAPADFVARQQWRIPRGAKVLSIAEGEGRNAVYLAEQGAQVTALESSANARGKAADLARERGVSLAFISDDLRGYDWPDGIYDFVLGCFFQFADPAFRDEIFDGIAQALTPGGIAMIHGFARRQPRYGSGGPGQVSQLYDLDLLHQAFPRWEVLHQADYDADLDSGTGHSGRAALIDFVVRKPER
ncbi:SAM-dependent methyltransferase [Thioclava dalianensis]|uniref:SAM-dependent methyltransferase n=1 Tax=Thioclava dalianensis TaxID=1185766 RepID=A0A074U1U7_9RHOB|nr:class I SAM-dependent methyltransferase [Thioclava dalianensis]KEP68652.1 SAM-dependent methyltransferase [Thioclava dalianensis]